MIGGWSISRDVDDKSTLVQVMAWCRQATSHYLSQCWPRTMSPYGITWPQWVNVLWFASLVNERIPIYCNKQWNFVPSDFTWYWLWHDIPIPHILQCIRKASHTAPFFNINVRMCAYFCYKMVHCGKWTGALWDLHTHGKSNGNYF